MTSNEVEPRTLRQRGSVWIILLVLVATVVGAWQYNEHKAEKKRLARAELQRQQEGQARQAEEARRESERQQLEKRLIEEKQRRDALASANQALDSLLGRWDDAVKLASNTSRIALSGPVTTLQSIKREAERLTVSPCMDQAKRLLLKSMESTTEGFLEFMRNQMKIGDKLAQIDFDAAAKDMAAFRTARVTCPQ